MSIKTTTLLSLISLLSVFPVCGEGQSEAQNSDPVELRFFWWGSESRHEATLRAVEAYNESQSDCRIHAEYQDWEGYYEKITTQLAAGSAPDVFQFSNSWVNEYWDKKDVFYDLRSLDQINLENWPDSALAMSSIGSSVIGAPLGQNARILIYNKNMTDRLSIDLSRYFSWEEFAGMVERARSIEPNLVGYSANLDQLNYALIAYVVQVSGKPFITENLEFGFSEEDLTEGLELFVKWFGDSTFQPLSRINFLDTAWTDPAWLEGRVLFSETPLTRLAQHADYDFPIGLTRYWMKDGAVMSGNPVGANLMFSLSGRTGHPEEAADFLNYILEDGEGVKLMGLQRGVPSNKKAYMILDEAGYIDDVTRKALKILKDSDTGMFSYLELNRIGESLSKTIRMAGFGDQSPEEAARYFMTTGNALLAEYR